MTSGDIGDLPLPLTYPPIMGCFDCLVLDAIASSLMLIPFCFPQDDMSVPTTMGVLGDFGSLVHILKIFGII